MILEVQANRLQKQDVDAFKLKNFIKFALLSSS